MKKIRDFVYDFSDIFITLIILAIAGLIIFWRVQVIMGYSDYVSSNTEETTIDIDFSDIDLTPEPVNPIIPNNPNNPNEQEGENQEGEEPDENEPIELDLSENFRSPTTVYVSIPAGCEYSRAIRLLASAYELGDNDYFTLYNLLWDVGLSLGAETRIQIDTFTIPEGSSLEEMIKIITRMN